MRCMVCQELLGLRHRYMEALGDYLRVLKQFLSAQHPLDVSELAQAASEARSLCETELARLRKHCAVHGCHLLDRWQAKRDPSAFPSLTWSAV